MRLIGTALLVLCLMGLFAVAQQPTTAPATPAPPPVATTPQETPPPQPSTTASPQQEAPAIQQAVTPKEPASPTAAKLQKPEPTTAMVYVYRYKQYVGSALSPSVYCDEVQLARMDNGRYFSVALAPGKHAFRSNDKQSGLELDLKAGQIYFIRVEIATGFWKGHGRLIQMTSEQGSYELKSKQLQPLDAAKTVDRTRVSVEAAQLE
ncbi:MAG: DUF2846 domain-containing protein [Candidatus Korobacteraceae bacterium]